MNKKRLLLVNEFSGFQTGYSGYGHEILTRLHNSGRFHVGELATYVKQDDARLVNVPWVVYPNMPANAEEEAIYNSNALNQFGQWKFEKVCLDFKPDIIWCFTDFWYCLTPYTPIVCDNGPKPIKDVNIGDTVLTHTGNWRKVTAKLNRAYSGGMVTINSTHSREPIEITYGHPVLAIKRNSSPGLPDLVPQDLEWISSEKLRKGDIVCFPISKTNEETNITASKARIIGYYAAEGCLLYAGKKKFGKLSGVQFSMNNDEWASILDLVERIKTVYNLEVSIKQPKNSNGLVLRVFSKQMAEEMKYFCPGLAPTKVLNKDIFLTPNYITKEFLCSYFRGDGYVGIKSANCTSASKSLAYQVFQLCLRHGILPTFGRCKNKLNGKTYYSYRTMFAKESFDGYQQLLNGEEYRGPRSKRIDSHYAYMTIRDVRHWQSDCQVYNLEVEKDNSYVSSFCLHNCEFILRSPFRRFFKWIWMPTCDAVSQAESWIAGYLSIDAVLAYNDWSLTQLQKEGGNLIKLRGTAPPAANLEIFKPLANKAEIKVRAELPADALVIGTVNRNQKRKLFDDLIQAFALLQKEAPAELSKRTYLYLHTAAPDIGWDITQILRDNHVTHRTLVTYSCKQCGAAFAGIYQDIRTFCRNCGSKECSTPNSQQGVGHEVMNQIYNLFDVYVQYCNSEGYGIGQVEAAAAGIPIMSVDYSAMSDVARKLRGTLLKPLSLYKESETGCYRAVPDNKLLVEKLIGFLSLPEELRRKKGFEARRAAEQHYSYDKSATKWMEVFDNLDCASHDQTWLSPIRPIQPNLGIPERLSNQDFVNFVLIYVAGRPDLVNTYLSQRMLEDLNTGISVENLGGFYWNSADYLGFKNNRRTYNRDDAINDTAQLCAQHNFWENERAKIL